MRNANEMDITVKKKRGSLTAAKVMYLRTPINKTEINRM